MRKKIEETLRGVATPKGPKELLTLIQQRDRQVAFLSRLVAIMGVLQAAATIPQAYQLYSSQDASGLSFASWLYYSIFAIVLVAYGVVQHQKPIIISYTANAIAYTSIAIGIILYR